MRDKLLAFSLHRCAIVLRDGGCGARLAAAAPARRVMDAVEHRLNVEFVALARANLHELTEPAAILPGAAAVGAQLLAPDDDGADLLGRFDRHGHHTRG